MQFEQRPRSLRRFIASCCLLVAAATAVSAAGWSTSGTKIISPAGMPFTITGVNWYGFETRDNVAHGMWTKDYKVIIDQIRQHGYNTIRIPFSNAMWETNPVPNSNQLSACPECKGKRARDIMALIVNYAGSVGLHVILDNHRSTAGNSAQENGLWYASGYPEQAWIRDWVSVQEWVHGVPQTLGAPDTIAVNYTASDGLPIVLGYDLRNEPHTPSRKAYLDGATWGTGDGISPATNPNPNPFAPACVASSTCRDWRLAAQRAGDTILGEALRRGWDYPLIFVEGTGMYPTAAGTPASGPYDGYWWGGCLLGVNGNARNPGAPVVLNAGGSAAGLGPAVNNQLVYSAHDYGPALFRQSWFNASTCYRSGCSASSLADVWKKFWAHLNLPGGVNPVGAGGGPYPWANTGHTGYSQAPVWIGEFGTGKADADVLSAGAGSQGQWFTDMINFIQSSHARTPTNDSGLAVADLHWTYWALNTEDNYGLLGNNYAGLANSRKQYSFLCQVQSGPLALPRGTGAGQCGSTGPLPAPQ
ncbi:MAG: cellulase family glycosylhydrolase [Acidobacteriota bacterium]|nr:cellulase family glycosylhydrolase [Acidobacteriota bacterium]